MEEKNIEEEIILPEVESFEKTKKRYMEYETRVCEEIKKELEEKGFKKCGEERIQKLTQIYKEMLDYKNIKYDEKFNFYDFTCEIQNAYYLLEQECYYVHLALTEKKIYIKDEMDGEEKLTEISEEKCIFLADELYRNLTPKEEFKGYKEYADYNKSDDYKIYK